MSSTPYNTQNTVKAAELGASATDVVSFYGETGTAQRASAAQAALNIDAITSSSPFGWKDKADADATLALLEEIRATLVAVGLMKGSA